jgi:Uncharacterized protein conserved in bacteria
LAGRSFAQDAYPTRTITVINPFPPGGASDVVSRPLVAAMEPIVKQPVIIETKAGAAGAIGAQFAANAKPDGYTCYRTSRRSPALPRSIGCSAASQSSLMPISFRLPASSPIRA